MYRDQRRSHVANAPHTNVNAFMVVMAHLMLKDVHLFPTPPSLCPLEGRPVQ